MRKGFGNRNWKPAKVKRFNPDSLFISEKVREYLANDGKITKIVMDEEAYKKFMSLHCAFQDKLM